MNKMKLVLTKIGIAFSALAMIVAFNGASSGFAAGSDKPQDEITQAGTAETTADVVVPPWCGWNINPVASNITLYPAGEASYVGVDLVLTGSTNDVNAYVGGETSAESILSPENCSWFGNPEQSASFDVKIDEGDAGFTAASGGSADPEMDWSLSEKPLVIENDFSEGCVTNGFTPNTSPVEISSSSTTNVWEILLIDVETNNFCKYSVDYTATIPAGMMPTYGDSTYTFTGPSLIHTLTTE
jgi:hypothetical protein